MNTTKSKDDNSFFNLTWVGKEASSGPTLSEQLEKLPEYIEFRTALIKTLDLFPDAKEAVIQTLRERKLKEGSEKPA